jgi:hypothetical protein
MFAIARVRENSRRHNWRLNAKRARLSEIGLLFAEFSHQPFWVLASNNQKKGKECFQTGYSVRVMGVR